MLIRSFIGVGLPAAYPRSMTVSSVVLADGGLLRKVPVPEIAVRRFFLSRFCQIHQTLSIMPW